MDWINIILNIGTPLAFVVVGIYANRLGSKDGDTTPGINYFAVGSSVFIMSLATILADVTIDANGNLEGNFGWMVLYLVFIFISVDADRYTSWERDEEGKPTTKKHAIRGVIVPNTLGVVAFCLYRFMV